MQFPAFLGLPASLPVRCQKNEALSNSIPVTAVTSFETRQVHRSSQVCTPGILPSAQIGAAPRKKPGPARPHQLLPIRPSIVDFGNG
jgi:hypothetical protein